ncbi:MAG: PAS domain S-box protein [Chthonomonadales bacterium]|nr:PAS domain S-box protein [Chthonomonadales bacterium]
MLTDEVSADEQTEPDGKLPSSAGSGSALTRGRGAASCGELDASALAERARLHERLAAQTGDVVYYHDYTAECYRFIDERIGALTDIGAASIRPVDWQTLIQDVVLFGSAEGLSRAEASRRMEAGDLPAWSAEYRVRTRTGRELWLSDSSIPVRDAEGAMVGAFGVLRDITVRRRAQEALCESEGRFRALFESAGDAVVILDGVTVADCNHRALLVFAATREQLIGRTVAEISPPVQPDGRESGSAAAACLQNLSAAEPRHVEWRHQRLDGTPFEADVVLQPIRYGSARRVQALVRDVTERKQLEAQTHQARMAEAIGRLAGGIAHDFNSLLTGVLGNVDLARAEPGLTPGLLGCLDQIERAAERAAALTGQLLAFARKQSVQPEDLDLRTLLASMAKLLRSLTGDSVRLHLLPSAHQPVVRVDRAQMEQVIINLVVNARDAMPDGGTLTVETRTLTSSGVGDAPAGSWVLLAVSDTGDGMDGPTRARIFEPFFTTRGVSPGRGLGLPTCQGIVEQAGGCIRVDSEPGAGSTFRVYLPNLAAQSTAVVHTAARPEPGDRPTILLAEDEPMVREVARVALEAQGYRVLAARDGAEALKLLDAEGSPVDLLLTDIAMPGMDGRELAAAVRERVPEVRILLMSGYTEAESADAERPWDLLAKPFTPAALARRVRDLFGRSEPP